MCACAGLEAARTIFDNPAGGIFGFVPLEGYRTGGGVVGDERVGTRARRDGFDGEVVDVGIPVAAGHAIGRTENEAVAVAGVVVEGEFEELPLGVAVDDERVDRSEGGGIVVGHDTDNEGGSVGRAGRLAPEYQLKCVHGEDGGVDQGECHHLIGAVGNGGGHIPVETLATAGSVVVGGAAGEVGVVVGSGVGEALPAGDVEVARGRAGGVVTLQIVVPRHGVDDDAFGTCIDNGGLAGVAGCADGTDRDVVGRVGCETSDEQRGIVDDGAVAVVGDYPLMLIAGRSP